MRLLMGSVYLVIVVLNCANMPMILRSLLCRMRPWLEVFSLFRRYELASGAKLNVTKSHGLLVGTWASRVNLPVPLDWSAQRITVMGAPLSNVVDDASWDCSFGTSGHCARCLAPGAIFPIMAVR